VSYHVSLYTTARADPPLSHSEVETTLHSLSTLSSSYSRLSRTNPLNSEELSYALAELRATLLAIEGDVVELEESVEAVEERGVAARLGISEGQVRERRSFVERVKREIQVGAWGCLLVEG
jgi:predicted  nucleic acid-binding Zn-ribbon protein